MMIIFAIIILILSSIFSLIVSLYFIFTGFYWMVTGIPFVKSDKNVLRWVEKNFVFPKSGKFYDLGAGSGTVINFFAKKHPDLNFVGVELNPFLVFWGRVLHGRKNIEFLRKDFLKVDFSDADCVFLFLFPEAMEKLAPKLKKELRPGVFIVSNSFKFSDDWKPEISHIDKNPLRSVFIYRV